MAESGGESTLTVLVAMGANVGVAIAKAVAGIASGSAALLAEAAHSVGDTVTEVFLLTALRRSERPADRRHPFGYGKERYFWSLLAAVSIFTAGALFSLYQGVTTLLGEPAESDHGPAGYIVLAVAFVLESVSLSQAVRQVHRERTHDRLGLRDYLRLTDDPTVKTVLFEDVAALIGILIAFAGLALSGLTGSPLWDGLAALAIGLLLMAVAYGLGRTNQRLIVGRQADPRLVRAVADRLRDAPEVDALVDVLTMLIGADRVLVCARLDFDDSLTAADVERACIRLDQTLRECFAEVEEVFLEPVPRTDPELRARVQARYGRALG